MTSLRIPLAVVIVVTPALQAVAPARAEAPATGFESLRTAAGKGEVKIWSRQGAFSFERAQFDSTGIWSKDPSVYRVSRRAWIQSAEVDSSERVPHPIAWEGVDSIAVLRQQGMSGAERGGVFVGCVLISLFSGLAVGYMAYAGEPYGLAALVPFAAAGVAIGVGLGAGNGTVEVVYRAR